MVWAHFYASDGTLLLVCPAQEASLWYLFDGPYWWKYVLVPAELPCP